MSYKLSKSKFVVGVQCPNWLWWQVREPDAPELRPDLATQFRFQQGTRVGEVARDHVPDGVLINQPHWAIDRKIGDTQAALDAGATVICEAGFTADGVFAAVDILQRDGENFDLIEVKSSSRVKDAHLPDAAIQAHILRQCGLNIRCVEIMHLNPQCRYPDLTDLFVREDVTAPVERLLPDIPTQIEEQLEIINGPCPNIPIGRQCVKATYCPFKGRCWPDMTGDHVGSLAGVGLKKTLELMQQGYHSIHQLPDDIKLSKPAQRQRRALDANGIFVDDCLAEALEAFQGPLVFLDFETVNLAIPAWEGCTPWEQVPVQFSCHIEEESGDLIHREWLAKGPGDPREALALALLDECKDAQAVVAYYASFERRCIERLATALPHLADELLAISGKLTDLHPVVKNHVYHPGFGGSFSLKPVISALVPELAYGDLEITDGDTASVELVRLIFHPESTPPRVTEQLRENLLAYCERDTWVMVKLLEKLRELAG